MLSRGFILTNRHTETECCVKKFHNSFAGFTDTTYSTGKLWVSKWGIHFLVNTFQQMGRKSMANTAKLYWQLLWFTHGYPYNWHRVTLTLKESQIHVYPQVHYGFRKKHFHHHGHNDNDWLGNWTSVFMPGCLVWTCLCPMSLHTPLQVKIPLTLVQHRNSLFLNPCGLTCGIHQGRQFNILR